MRKLYLLFVPVLFVFSACKKVNNEVLESDFHQIMKGDWSYDHFTRNGVVDMSVPDAEFIINFSEKCITFIENDEETKYKLYNLRYEGHINIDAEDEWDGVYTYGTNQETRYLKLTHIDANTMAIEKFPYDVQELDGYDYLLDRNIFKKN